MKYPVLSALLLSLVLFFSACESAENEGEATTTDTTATTEPIEEPLEMIDPDVLPAKTFGYFGLDLLNIGDSLTFAALQTELPVKDTLFVQPNPDGGDDYAWSVRILELEKGRVFLEADFEENMFLNRVRIESPEYRHFATGLGVGSTVEEIKAAHPGLVVQPFAEFGVIELIPNQHNIFHIEQPAQMDLKAQPILTLDDLDPNAKVVRVVVM